MKENKSFLRRLFSRSPSMFNGIPIATKQQVNQAHSQNFAQSLMMKNGIIGYGNTVEGSGTVRDIDVYEFRSQPPYMQYVTLDNMYRTNWMAAKLIDIPAEDMTAKWREFEHKDPKVVEERKKAELKYNVVHTVRNALKWSALYGGAAIILSFNNNESPGEPLDVKRIKKGELLTLNVVFKDQINPSTEIELNPYSPNFGKARHYTVANAPNVNVHASRVILFYGHELPLYASLFQVGWGDSELLKAWNILNIAEKIWVNISNLVSKSLIDVMKVPNFMELVSQKPDQIFAMLGMQAAFASNFKTKIIGNDQEFERKELSSITGLSDIMTHYLQLISGSADMPLTRFLGTSVGGFSSGDNELTQYYESITQKQVNHNNQIRRLDQIIEMSIFGELKEIEYEWLPVAEMKESEKSKIEIERAQRDAIYLEAGVISEQIVAKQLQQEGTYVALDDEFIEGLSDDPGDKDLDLFDLKEGDSEDNEEGKKVEALPKVKTKPKLALPK